MRIKLAYNVAIHREESVFLSGEVRLTFYIHKLRISNFSIFSYNNLACLLPVIVCGDTDSTIGIKFSYDCHIVCGDWCYNAVVDKPARAVIGKARSHFPAHIIQDIASAIKLRVLSNLYRDNICGSAILRGSIVKEYLHVVLTGDEPVILHAGIEIQMRNKVGDIKRIRISVFSPFIRSVLNRKSEIASFTCLLTEVLPVRGDISSYACALVNIDIFYEGVLSYVDGVFSASQGA